VAEGGGWGGGGGGGGILWKNGAGEGKGSIGVARVTLPGIAARSGGGLTSSKCSASTPSRVRRGRRSLAMEAGSRRDHHSRAQGAWLYELFAAAKVRGPSRAGKQGDCSASSLWTGTDACMARRRAPSDVQRLLLPSCHGAKLGAGGKEPASQARTSARPPIVDGTRIRIQRFPSLPPISPPRHRFAWRHSPWSCIRDPSSGKAATGRCLAANDSVGKT